jgi:hypothetical protein
MIYKKFLINTSLHVKVTQIICGITSLLTIYQEWSTLLFVCYQEQALVPPW